jgi:hypothetical protein
MSLPLRVTMLGLLLACEGPKGAGPACPRLEGQPDDDPAAWSVDAGVDWQPTISEPTWVVPSAALPVETQAANNNVAITLAGDRLFMAFRSAPAHFASSQTTMNVVSSADGGQTWEEELVVALGTDLREPAFLLWDGVLSLSFFEAGANPAAFEPRAVWRAERCDVGDWQKAPISEGEKVPWDVKIRQGMALRTAYSGDHYGDGDLSVHLERSTDGGRSWGPLGQDPVHQGGDSEVAFELDETGALWAVTRNEDGDETGQGSKVCTAPSGDLSDWSCSDPSDPERYDSPELIRHGEDLYLLARRDVGGPFGEDEGLIPYSSRPKRSALYQLLRDEKRVVHLFDIPGVGDTAFVSAHRTGAHTWLFANYSSPLEEADDTWLEAQIAAEGTQIYLATLTFAP